MRVTAGALGAAFFVAGCSSPAPEESAQGRLGVATLTGETLETSVHLASCMDVRGGSSANGAQIDEWACSGSAAQVFQIRS